jgi:molecular chaperone DnaK
MAQYNKTLGNFQLSGIAPAPRGIPQIEVTFDIDANGIVHVAAKDLGTGNEQNITITASTNLSEDEINKAVKEAEQYAAEDKQRKEEVDLRNSADQMVYQAEKLTTDMGDKMTEDEKNDLKAEADKVKETLKGTDTEAIKAASDALMQKMSAIGQRVYQEAAAQRQAQGGAGEQQGPAGAQDADFTDVN